MKTNNITTLEELAQYINQNEDYPMDVEDIVKANGWTLGDNDFDVCKDANEVLTMDENTGVFVVRAHN